MKEATRPGTQRGWRLVVIWELLAPQSMKTCSRYKVSFVFSAPESIAIHPCQGWTFSLLLFKKISLIHKMNNWCVYILYRWSRKVSVRFVAKKKKKLQPRLNYKFSEGMCCFYLRIQLTFPFPFYKLCIAKIEVLWLSSYALSHEATLAEYPSRHLNFECQNKRKWSLFRLV